MDHATDQFAGMRLATDQVWDAVTGLIATLEPDDWNRPTPCVGWSVKDVLSHLGHVEGMLVHQFAQPEAPADWVGEGSPLDQVTGQGVAARRGWSQAQVVDEIERAAAATRAMLSSPDLDWQEPALTPVGPAPRSVAVEMRVNDAFLHLCDIRTAIGRSIDGPAVDEPGASSESLAREVAIGRAVRLSPWAWAKRVGAGEGQRLRLSLSGPAGVEHDVVMRGGKAVVEGSDGIPEASINGTALAYLLAVSGRHALVPAGGGLVATGEPARAFLEKFRLVG
jgi:uncharacterized protein (TIGR03083 family)